MKGLITGGAGFIGYHLATRLSESGAEITLIDNLSRGVQDAELTRLLEKVNVCFRQMDLLDREAVLDLDTDYDLIYHLAAIIGVRHVLENPYEVLSRNVALLDNVIALGRKQTRLKRFVFTSTSEIYAGTLRHDLLPIPTPEAAMLTLPPLTEPRTGYMLSKLYGEAMCSQSGLDFTIVRPHNFYGPRMGLSHVIPELCRKLRDVTKGESVTVFSPDHTRTFCYIEDAVATIHALSLSQAGKNEVFNVGTSGPEIRMIDLAEMIADITESKAVLAHGEETTGSPVRRCPDVTKAVSASGYTPGILLEEGIRKTYAWYRTHVFDGNEASAI